VAGGMAPVRPYVDELLPDVLSGAIEPGLVFDLSMPLDQVSDAYAAMDQRRAIKVVLEP
jgi:threonine dehydrogenase-like Zn-dependent dehydrogenase